ncbi:MAG: hypothetical protein ABIC18_02350, partial [Candidatus Omnitrophota bacterium]
LKNAEDEKQRLDSQIESMQSKLNQEEEIRRGLEAKQIKTEEEIVNLRILIQDLQASRKALEGELDEEETKKVTLGKIVVGQQRSPGQEASVKTSLQESAKAQAAPTLKGKVLLINKDYNFIIIDLGSNDGAGISDVFSVYRNNNYIGDIQVEKLQETMSACGFLSGKSIGAIKESDQVIRK